MVKTSKHFLADDLYFLAAVQIYLRHINWPRGMLLMSMQVSGVHVCVRLSGLCAWSLSSREASASEARVDERRWLSAELGKTKMPVCTTTVGATLRFGI